MMLDPAIGMTFSVFLVGLFGLAAWHKLGHAAQFEQALAGYGLLPNFALAPARLVLGGFEVAAIAMLLVPATTPLGAILAAVLLGLYAIAMARALSGGRAGMSCGCDFGPKSSELSWAMVSRNAGLILVALMLVLPASRGLAVADVFNGAAAGLTLLLVYHSAGVIQSNRNLISKLSKRGA